MVSAAELSVLIPAAGASTRLGRAKQLVEYQGKPLLEHVIDVVASISPFEIIVVTGANADAITGMVPNRGVRWLHNPRWEDGLGRSIAHGAMAINPETAGLMIMLCDQYRVQETDLLALLDRWRATPGKIVAAEARGRCMPPLIFPSHMLSDLAKLTGTAGAHSLLARYPERVTAVPMPSAGFDLDRPEQLRDL